MQADATECSFPLRVLKHVTMINKFLIHSKFNAFVQQYYTVD